MTEFKFVWSHSALVEFRQCPYKFYRKRVVRDVKEAPTEALEKGNIVHKMFEERIKHGTPITAVPRYEKMVEPILRWDGRTDAEVDLGMTRDGAGTGFFGSSVWGRGKIDVLNLNGNRARVVDWKTGGRVRLEDSRHQAETNALLLLANYPNVVAINVVFAYLELGKVTPYEYTRNDQPRLRASVDRAFGEVEYAAEHDMWSKRSSGLCPWCPVTDCPNWKPKPPGR
jgi:RecB family exonuclease